MKNTLVKATTDDGSIRLIAVLTTEAANEAKVRHSLSFITSVLLSRAMSAGLILASSMKVKQGRITIKIQSDGPLKGLYVDAGKNGTVRGYVGNPTLELDLINTSNNKPYFNFSKAVGQGYLHVTRDNGQGEPFTSTVEIIEGGIGEDIASYLLHSEQTKSAVLVGEKIEHNKIVCSGALMAQVLPKAKENNLLINQLSEECKKISNFSEILSESRNNLPDLFSNLFPSLSNQGIRVLEINNEIHFNCRCSMQRSISALQLLGRKELIEILNEDKKSELTCKFCSSKYLIDENMLISIIKEMNE